MKLVIFDLDGTLFNTVPVNYKSYEKALNEQGFNLEYDFFKEYCNGRFYKEFLPMIVGDDTSLIERIHDRKKLLYKDFINQAIPNQALLQLAASLKGNVYTAVVTTASRENTKQLLDYYRCDNIFDKIFTREDYGKSKPDPEGFLLAMKWFSVKGEDTLIFEDSEVGIKAAESCGADCCIVLGYR